MLLSYKHKDSDFTGLWFHELKIKKPKCVFPPLIHITSGTRCTQQVKLSANNKQKRTKKKVRYNLGQPHGSVSMAPDFPGAPGTRCRNSNKLFGGLPSFLYESR